MNRTALCGAILSAALAVGVSAQTGAGTQGQDKMAQKAGAITVTGCLAADTASAPSAPSGGATGTSGTTAPRPEGFILKNVTASPAAATSSPAATEYTLIGGNKSELKKFENSKVEIKGQVEDAKPAAGAAAAAGGPRLHVDSVKQIAASCSN